MRENAPRGVIGSGRRRGMGGRFLRSAALGTVFVIAFTACIKTSGGGASPNPNKVVPKNNPAGGGTSTPAPTTVFYIPLAFDLPDAVLSALQVMPRPTSWSADVNTIQQPAAIRASFKKDGFLSEGEQVVAKTGLKLDDPKSWPDGSSVYLEWKVTYFQTPDDASAAMQFAGKNERGKPVTLSGLGARGISAFQAVNPD